MDLSVSTRTSFRWLPYADTSSASSTWLQSPLLSPAFTLCRNAHLSCCAPLLFRLSVSVWALPSPPELLSTILISSDLGGGREWDAARLYPNPPWIIAPCGAQSWATKTPTITNAFFLHQLNIIGHFRWFTWSLSSIKYNTFKCLPLEFHINSK